jgi:hypothetical protein
MHKVRFVEVSSTLYTLLQKVQRARDHRSQARCYWFTDTSAEKLRQYLFD